MLEQVKRFGFSNPLRTGRKPIEVLGIEVLLIGPMGVVTNE
jgi:hypothetical protein